MRFWFIALLGCLFTLEVSAQEPKLTTPSQANATPTSISPLKSAETEKPSISESTPVVDQLIAALSDSDFEVRQNVSHALARMGKTALPKVLLALKDTDRYRRAGAAYAISQMRPVPESALKPLLEALKDKEDIVRRQAAYAISRVIPETTVESKEPPVAKQSPRLDLDAKPVDLPPEPPTTKKR